MATRAKEATHLVIVSHNREGFDEHSLVLFDDLLYKPFTPSTLYDTVISCNSSSTSLMESVSGEGDEKLLAKTLILVVEDNPINQQVAGSMLKGRVPLLSSLKMGKSA